MTFSLYNDLLMYFWSPGQKSVPPAPGRLFDLYQNITICASNFYDMNLITFLSIYAIKQLPYSLLSAYSFI
jgi:hypothetical protein